MNSDINKKKIITCPFCEGELLIKQYGLDFFAIKCSKCSMQFNETFKTKEEAIAACVNKPTQRILNYLIDEKEKLRASRNELSIRMYKDQNIQSKYNTILHMELIAVKAIKFIKEEILKGMANEQ